MTELTEKAVFLTVEGLCNVNAYKYKDFFFHIKTWILRETTKSEKKCKSCKTQRFSCLLFSIVTEEVKYEKYLKLAISLAPCSLKTVQCFLAMKKTENSEISNICEFSRHLLSLILR